jgi:hypothetical protein
VLPFGRQQHGKIVNVHYSWPSVDGEPGAVNPSLAPLVVAHKGKGPGDGVRGVGATFVSGLS